MILRSEEHTLEILQMDAMRVWNRYSYLFSKSAHVSELDHVEIQGWMLDASIHATKSPFSAQQNPQHGCFSIAVNCSVRTTRTLLRSFARHLVGNMVIRCSSQFAQPKSKSIMDAFFLKGKNHDSVVCVFPTQLRKMLIKMGIPSQIAVELPH